MLQNIPIGIMRPELVQMVVAGFNRQQKFKQLAVVIRTERQAPCPNFILMEEIRAQLWSLFPECISTLHRKQRPHLKAMLNWQQRASRMPDCFVSGG